MGELRAIRVRVLGKKKGVYHWKILPPKISSIDEIDSQIPVHIKDKWVKSQGAFYVSSEEKESVVEILKFLSEFIVRERRKEKTN